MIKAVLDQGLPRSTASLLREESWDIVHVGEIGMSKASDLQILSFAEKEKRMVITLDADFHAALAVSNAAGPTVIRLRIEGLKAPQLFSLIKRIWPKIESAALEGAMVTVTDKAIRIRKLPLLP